MLPGTDDLFPDLKECGNATVVEEFKFVWQNLLQIARPFCVQQQHIIEFLVPMGQKWKSFRLVGRHSQRPQELIVRRSGAGSQRLGVRLAHADGLLRVIRKNGRPKSPAIQQDEGCQMPVGRIQMWYAASDGHGVKPCRIVILQYLDIQHATARFDGRDDLAHVAYILLRMYPHTGDEGDLGEQ